MEQTTALYHRHLAAGGKLVPFGGYLLPVQYPSGIMAEHQAVRTACGLFDVSHMGELLYTGPDALTNLNHLLTNDFTNMKEGQVRYSPMCNPQGGVLEDLIVYKYHDEKFLAVVNASNRHKDLAWMQDQLFGDVVLEDVSDRTGLLALQGPRATQVLARLADGEALPQKYYSFAPRVTVAGLPCMVSRTGYTGELGYELYLDWDDTPALWDALLEAGSDLGLIPCGLGARDTLRLEAAMPLYGHEMDETITPLEVGLDFAVKLEKPGFIGKEALLAQNPPARRRVGLRVTGRGIIREGAAVYLGETLIGHTTSGTHLPHLGYAGAMALVDAAHTQPGLLVEADVRGRRIPAEIVPLPFYQRSKP